MIKYLCIAILFFVCAFGGIRFSKSRLVILEKTESLIYDIKLMRDRLAYSAAPVRTLLCGNGYKNSDIWESAAHGLSGNVSAAWKQMRSEMCFDASVLLILDDFFETLGASGMENQLKNMDMTLKRLEEALKLLEPAMKQKAKLYRSLGILLGFAVSILML